MDYDEYVEVINGNSTYKTIAKNLKNGIPILIGWTDEKSTHYDILFTYRVNKNGYTQGGIRENDLYISVMRIGTFGFEIDSLKNPGYIAEKIFHNRLDESVEKMTELINGIIKELNNE